VGSWGIMLGSVDRPRGISAAEALKAKFGTARFPYLLLAKDKDKVRDRGKDSDPSNHSRIEVGRRPTPTSTTRHLSKPRPELPTNCPGTMEVESM